VKAHEGALYSADAVMSQYVNALPPDDRMTDERYRWTTRNAAALLQVDEKAYRNGEIKEEEPSILNEVHDDLLFRAYSTENGGERINELRKSLADKEKMMRDYFDKIKGAGLREKFSGLSDLQIYDQINLAISMFVVEDYVKWANWIHLNIGKEVPVWSWRNGRWEEAGTTNFNSWVRKEDILNVPQLKLLSESEGAGVYMVEGREGREFFVTGHSEYSPFTLDVEYRRDKEKGLPIELPQNYYRDNDPTKEPLVRWRGHANLLFSNWLNYFVYQETPYNIEDIK
jgi:hypothetical protein